MHFTYVHVLRLSRVFVSNIIELTRVMLTELISYLALNWRDIESVLQRDMEWKELCAA
ncbi:hypothetical protein PghCCS26_10280 [Paenibacillus glycanilyticus]|uniref:Transposase n=1 Tax=Paenibacillus glycanilyticus TaxID=126569 RepID=A0ABQ6NFL4_9BACL|nr:hypothetical protein PghCCS26_10280 [Paenibacillus glycanilyticus]